MTRPEVSRETAPTTEQQFGELLRTADLNLVSRRDRDELHDRHLPESRAFALGLPRATTFVDVGSGGGLPGLVLAIWRAPTPVVLVESRRKKAAWLRRTAGELGLRHTRVVHDRVESVAPHAGAVITARAVAPLPRLLDLVRPAAAPGSTLHAIKGARWKDELRACGDLADLGWTLVATPDEPGGHRTAPVDSADPHPNVVILRAR